MSDPALLSLGQAVQAVRAGRISPDELLRASRAPIERWQPRINAARDAATAGELTRLTRWVNYLGVPALVVPCGLDSRGLPMSVQFVGRPFAEATVLAAGHAFQRETDWHQRVRA